MTSWLMILCSRSLWIPLPFCLQKEKGLSWVSLELITCNSCSGKKNQFNKSHISFNCLRIRTEGLSMGMWSGQRESSPFEAIFSPKAAFCHSLSSQYRISENWVSLNNCCHYYIFISIFSTIVCLLLILQIKKNILLLFYVVVLTWHKVKTLSREGNTVLC